MNNTCNPTRRFGFGFALKWVHSWFANFFKLIFNLSPFLDHLDHLMTIYWLVNLSQFTQKLYLAPNRKANLTSTISVAIYNTHKFKLSLLICSKKKNHVLKKNHVSLFIHEKKSVGGELIKISRSDLGNIILRSRRPDTRPSRSVDGRLLKYNVWSHCWFRLL